MNKQRKVLITITYNEMGMIIDTKAEEVAQQNLQQTCNQLATDTIYRQEAIEALGDMPLAWEEGEYELGLQNQWMSDVNTIKELPSAQQWIPCNERLPNMAEDVLVTRAYDGREDGNKSCRYVEIASCYGESDWNSFSDEYKMHPRAHKVIAWQPLPEPYKERREE